MDLPAKKIVWVTVVAVGIPSYMDIVLFLYLLNELARKLDVFYF